MRTKLLKILRKDAEKVVKIKTERIYGDDGKSRAFFVDVNGKHRDCFIGNYFATAARGQAYERLLQLRREWILLTLKNLKIII